MSVPERRKIPRATMERLAYINIEPNNGGIVLNVSEQGLCFHSIAPVVPDGEIRFSLLEQNRRIEAGGELAWVDELAKVGGLRFTDLSPEALEQIRNWATHPSDPFSDDEDDEPAVSVVAPRSYPAFPSQRNESFSGPAPSVAPLPSSPDIRKTAFLTGFSGGLAVGLAITVLVTAGFLFHAYRHQIGESLIQVGLRLSAKAAPQVQASSPDPTPVVPPAKLSAPASPSATVPQVPHHENPVQQAQSAPPKAQETEIKSQNPAASILQVRPSRRVPSLEPAPAQSLPPSLALASASVEPIPNLIFDKARALPRLELPARSNLHTEDAGAGTGPPPPMFFEVGKFKQELWARKATDQLAQLGLPASISQKGRLRSSYYVLVGPYSDPEIAGRAHQKLAAGGFKPRPYERGSRDFTLSSGVILNGTRMTGDFVISWESYIPDAKVKFLQNDFLVTTVDGRWVDRGVRTPHNAFVYQRNPDGSHTLIEVRFGGMSRVLVFNKPSES